ncbi:MULTISPECIES: thioesterase family protein [Brachybacterium]|uniref:acyl-CoA thioesterase n=1 Tax=Brachybacterium TaxID=43668 RepID=UPI0007A54CF6|nr:MULTISPECIES: thioesterase family protein [Brachybacterium]
MQFSITTDATPEHPAPLDVPVPVRWTDLDAYGHVNNAAMVRLLEEARIAAFWQPSPEQLELGAQQPPAALPISGAGADLATVIASQRIEYARQLGHRRDGVVVRLWLSRIGGASLSADYLVLTRDDPEGRAPYARARTVMVLVDAASGSPVRLEQEVRESLRAFTGEPLTFRD